MVDARERYIAKSNTPAIGSYGGGEDFGSPFGGGPNQPPGTTNEAAVSYGGIPPTNTGSGGGGSDDNNNLDNLVLAQQGDTGSGASGGESAPLYGIGLDSFRDITGSNIGRKGMDNIFSLMEDAPATGFNDYYNNLKLGDSANVNTGFDINPTGMDLPVLGEKKGQGVGYYGENFSATMPDFNQLQFQKNVGPGTVTGTYDDGGYGINYSMPLGNAQGGPISKYDEGGPVGGPEIDQSGIASLYPSGLRNPHVDEESRYYNPIGKGKPPQALLKCCLKEPSKPFGATRENVGEQLEAFRNAPHHVDPPNIGFFGEKIPAPLFDRAMKYLDSLPPSERAVVEEMIQRSIFEKRKQEMLEMQDKMEAEPTMMEA
jgi:hypothetical protein